MSFSRDCRKNRQRLPEYAEGGLKPQLRAEVERHLAGCLQCRAELRDVTIVIGALRSIEPDRLPDHLLPRVKRAVHQTMNAPTGMGHFWARISVPVAVVTAVAAIAFVLKAPIPHTLTQPATEKASQVGKAAGRGRSANRRLGQTGRMARKATPAPNPPFGIPGGGGGGPLTSPSMGSNQADSAQPAPAAGKPEVAQQKDSSGAAGVTSEQSAPAPAPPTAQPKLQAKAEMPPAPAPDKAEGIAPKTAALGAAGGAAPRPGSSAAFAKSADSAQAIATEEQAPPLSVSAHVGLTRKNGHSSVTLQFADRVTTREMKITIGYGSATRTIHVKPGSTASIALSSKDLGAGPSAVPITLQAGGRSRSYILFTPTQARMGEVAAESPRAIYDGVSAKTVLLHLSAFTGLIILAEKPLDQMFVGELSAGPPSDAVERLAAELDRTVARESEAVFLLSARQ